MCGTFRITALSRPHLIFIHGKDDSQRLGQAATLLLNA
jgi:hypothetical protein